MRDSLLTFYPPTPPPPPPCLSHLFSLIQVGRLGDAITDILSSLQGCERIIIETSGSAYSAPLVQELNRLARGEPTIVYESETQTAPDNSSSNANENKNSDTSANNIVDASSSDATLVTTATTRSTGVPRGGGSRLPVYVDGVACVVDVSNFDGHGDKSFTARAQAKYTDMILLNKLELANERQVDAVVDELLDLNPEAPIIRAWKGTLLPSYSVLAGVIHTFKVFFSTSLFPTHP